MNQIVLCAWSLGLLLWALPAQAQQILSPTAQPEMQRVWSDLAQAKVVYLGETHDRPQDHTAQLQIIQRLHQTHPRLAIGMEMFQRPAQEFLDQYLSGEITEDQLRQQSQYDLRWGFPWENYAPILRYAQANGLPVLALNVPTEITRQAASGGLESLSAADRQWIPPESEICTDNPDYRQFLRNLYSEFHQDHGVSDGFDNFVLAQVLWDETMAAGVSTFLQSHPDYQIVVLAGQGHIVWGYGIPDRVARRLGAGLVQRSVLLNPSEELSGDDVAHYLWFSPAASQP